MSSSDANQSPEEYQPPEKGRRASFEEVLIDEIRLIEERRKQRGDQASQPGDAAQDDDYAPAYRADLVGLSFSGGGIRSGTFNLGVIQGLAKLGLLSKVDYLSTVSGGGYIGSWLTGLIHRASKRNKSMASVELNLRSDRRDVFPAAVAAAEAAVTAAKAAAAAAAGDAGDATEAAAAAANAAATAAGAPVVAAATTAAAAATAEAAAAAAAADAAAAGQAAAAAAAAANDATAAVDDDFEAEAETVTESESQLHETPAIRFLRQFSNYLTPNVGFFSADTWSVFTTYLRNLLLVLVTLIAGVAAVLMLPRLLHGLFQLKLLPALPGTVLGFQGITWGLILAMLLVVISVVAVGCNMGGSSREMVEARQYSSPWFFKRFWVLVLVVLPLFLASIGGSQWLYSLSLQGRLWRVALGTATVYCFSWVLAFIVAWGYSRLLGSKLPSSITWGRLIGTGVPAGAVGGLMLFGIAWLTQQPGDNSWPALTWGPPLILVAYVLTASLQTGLVGRHLHDHHREWLSRVGAWLLIFAAAWAVLFAATVYGTPLVYWVTDWLRLSLTAGWLGATLAGLLASRGPSGNAKGSGLIRAFIGKAAPYVFIVGLLLWLGVGIDRVLSIPDSKSAEWRDFMDVCESARQPRNDSEMENSLIDLRVSIGGRTVGDELSEAEHALLPRLIKAHWAVLEVKDSKLLIGLFVGLVVVFVVMGWRVDVNEFSMHRFYRNRLVRCYLGASVSKRKREIRRQPFIGFCLTDDIDLECFGPEGCDERGRTHTDSCRGVSMGPYHLINTALNLVSGRQLAWQERKAASFIFSPLYCGFGFSGFEKGFRRTPGYGSDPKRLTLGTAMAISGAAASPNMGFRSSPALSFLLTVFNVRLGWWLGNPGLDRKGVYHRKPFWKHYWEFSGPRFAISELISELLGLTHEAKPYVYLSDGGHFENLGLYELVRRRCRLIIASDCGADPGLSFDDLGNAIRKCRVDLGIEIEIDPGQIRPEGGLSCWHWAVGTIHYSHEQKGTLLYLKSSISGDEPEDVLNYRAAHSEFPHQTTGDQWFDESQFESYRRLGEHVVLGALQEAHAESLSGEGVMQTVNAERLAQSLIERWHPPSKGVEEAFTKHSQKLDALYESLRNERHLEFLSEQIYPEWRSLLEGKPSPEPPGWLPAGPDSRRHGFYFCNSLIQLMEDVYLDLDLEHQWAHPDNRGWMNLFRHWSWSGMFQVTWAICASTYGLRFQRFCSRRLDLNGIYRLKVKELTKSRDRSSPIEVEEVEQWHELNFVERDIIRGILTGESKAFNTVYALLVEVKNPIEKRPDIKECMSYCCGFALAELTEGHRRIACMRIQDHLRMMGLARKALRELVKAHNLFDEPEFCGVAEKHESMFPSASMTRFLQLYRSVLRELRT
jgi:hypothetical protein